MKSFKHYFSKKFLFNLKIFIIHQYWHKSELYKFLLFRKITNQVHTHIANNEAHGMPAVLTALSYAVGYAYYSRVPGDIAEFGTQTGRTAVMLAANVEHYNRSFQHSGESRKVFYFDSFEGLPEPTLVGDIDSPFVTSGIWGQGGCKGLTVKEFSRQLSRVIDKDSFIVKVGWFKETLPTLEKSQKFSVVHIDGDLYESARDVLNFCFEMDVISNGAVLLFDDWNCNHSDLNYGERRAWREAVTAYKIIYSDEGSYGIFGHKFIVHSYSPLG